MDSLVRFTSWSRLGAIFSSKWAYELASLLLSCSWMEPRVCIAPCLGALISHDWMSFCSSATINGVLDGLQHFPCALVRFPAQECWKLYSAISGATNLVSLSMPSRQGISKAIDALCLWSWLKATHAPSSLMKTMTIGLVLVVISSVCSPLGFKVVGLIAVSHQPFLSDGAEGHSSQFLAPAWIEFRNSTSGNCLIFPNKFSGLEG